MSPNTTLVSTAKGMDNLENISHYNDSVSALGC